MKKIFAIITLVLMSLPIALVGCDTTPQTTSYAELYILRGQKTEYLVGESLEQYNLRYYADITDREHYDSLTTATQGVTISGFSTTTATTTAGRVLTVTYKGKSKQLTYYVYNTPTDIRVEDGNYFYAKNQILNFDSTTKKVTLKEYSGYDAYVANNPDRTTEANYNLVVDGGVVKAKFTLNNVVCALYYSETYKQTMIDKGSSYATISKFNDDFYTKINAGNYIAKSADDDDLYRYQIGADNKPVRDADDRLVKIYFDVHVTITADNKISAWLIDTETSNRTDLLTNASFSYDMGPTTLVIKLQEAGYSISSRSGSIMFTKYSGDVRYVDYGFSAKLVAED